MGKCPGEGPQPTLRLYGTVRQIAAMPRISCAWSSTMGCFFQASDEP